MEIKVVPESIRLERISGLSPPHYKLPPRKALKAIQKILDYVNDIIRLEEIWIVSIGEKRKNPPHWRVFRSMKFRNYYSGITTVSIT